mmetsp:Transcript_18754/g.53872  ORF Transcript_18754/g.53872 Transcript_18754/m.53872 type:complete len:251 (+) Transcript_18754:1592-2344(+)
MRVEDLHHQIRERLSNERGARRGCASANNPLAHAVNEEARQIGERASQDHGLRRLESRAFVQALEELGEGRERALASRPVRVGGHQVQHSHGDALERGLLRRIEGQPRHGAARGAGAADGLAQFQAAHRRPRAVAGAREAAPKEGEAADTPCRRDQRGQLAAVVERPSHKDKVREHREAELGPFRDRAGAVGGRRRVWRHGLGVLAKLLVELCLPGVREGRGDRQVVRALGREDVKQLPNVDAGARGAAR